MDISYELSFTTLNSIVQPKKLITCCIVSACYLTNVTFVALHKELLLKLFIMLTFLLMLKYLHVEWLAGETFSIIHVQFNYPFQYVVSTTNFR
jgi:hypothetical protein